MRIVLFDREERESIHQGFYVCHLLRIQVDDVERRRCRPIPRVDSPRVLCNAPGSRAGPSSSLSPCGSGNRRAKRVALDEGGRESSRRLDVSRPRKKSVLRLENAVLVPLSRAWGRGQAGQCTCCLCEFRALLRLGRGAPRLASLTSNSRQRPSPRSPRDTRDQRTR